MKDRVSCSRELDGHDAMHRECPGVELAIATVDCCEDVRICREHVREHDRLPFLDHLHPRLGECLSSVDDLLVEGCQRECHLRHDEVHIVRPVERGCGYGSVPREVAQGGDGATLNPSESPRS